MESLGDINNLREKFSPVPGFEPGSPALCIDAITTKLLIYNLSNGYSES